MALLEKILQTPPPGIRRQAIPASTAIQPSTARRARVDSLGHVGLLVVEQQRFEPLAHVPFDIVGEHAQEDVGAHAGASVVIDRAHFQVHRFEANGTIYLRDLNALTETAITYNGKTFVVRSNTVGVAGKIAQCVGVRLPSTVRQLDDEKESADQSL